MIQEAPQQQPSLPPSRSQRHKSMNPLSPTAIAIIMAASGLAGIDAMAAPAVVARGAADWLRGGGVIQPSGTPGFDGEKTNFKPYRLPGQNEDPLEGKDIPGDPFAVMYEATAKPVQTSDWWTSIGLQNRGWVKSRLPTENEVASTPSLVSEPFQMQFVDFGDKLFRDTEGKVAIDPPHGLRLWNQNGISVSTDGKSCPKDAQPGSKCPPRDQEPYNPQNNFAGRGEITLAQAGVVTVGLDGVHPLRPGNQKFPRRAPWTNVKVKSYSDWGVVAHYRSTDSKGNDADLDITMANGSPIVWFERTTGSGTTAPFLVWAGGSAQAGEAGGSAQAFIGAPNRLLLKVKIQYNPYQGLERTETEAWYAVFADKGTWRQRKKVNDLYVFENGDATKLAVLALPHTDGNGNAIDPYTAAADLAPYRCRRIDATRLDYPPDVSSVTINGKQLDLGYLPAQSLLRSQLRVTTDPNWNWPGCTAGDPLQLIFPHHRKVLLPAQARSVLGGSFDTAKYGWNTLRGRALAYSDETMVQQLTTYGVLPFLPSVGVNSTTPNPLQAGQTAPEDIYESMKTWFFVNEPNRGTWDPSHPDKPPQPVNLEGFATNPGHYDNAAFNTYQPGWSTLREGIFIADQLAQSDYLLSNDARLDKSKHSVSAEVRDHLLQMLKGFVGAWLDVYDSQVLQYHPGFNSIYGYPAGYGAVQSFSDHHFHYGYFLRAAAAIGRYDLNWLQQYLPIIDQLRQDVGTFTHGNAAWPFLRNMNPFFGHSWADGAAYNQNEESTSEAINFAVGLIELGDILDKPDWLNVGLYLYEQEILATEQYFFNQDADFSKVPKPNVGDTVDYNGNWPSSLVSYADNPVGQFWNTTLLGRIFAMKLDRATFFGPIDTTFAIHQVPLSASTLYLDRNQAWLEQTWQQFVRETEVAKAENLQLSDVYEVNLAGMQARLPQDCIDANPDHCTGLKAALTRIANLHFLFPGAVNFIGKHWAYTHTALGILDGECIADTPFHAVFHDENDATKRRFVVYNAATHDVSVTFRCPTSDPTRRVPVKTVTVPPKAMVTYDLGPSPVKDTLSPVAPPIARLYLHRDGTLTTQPGTFKIAPQSFPFPTGTDFATVTAKIAPSLSVVPKRKDSGPGDQLPSDPGDIITFGGYFSGDLIGAKAADCAARPPWNKPGCNPATTLQAITRMALYTDQCLIPGWQRCQLSESKGNTVSIWLRYFFDVASRPGCTPANWQACGAADRLEKWINVSLQGQDNTWLGYNTLSEYRSSGPNLGAPGKLVTGGFLGSYGLDLGPPQGTLPPFPNTCEPAPCGFWKDPNNDNPIPPGGVFPQHVDKGLLIVQIYGGKGDVTRDIAVSVDASPLLGRASWVKPPYE